MGAGAVGAKKRARTTRGRTQRAEGWSAGETKGVPSAAGADQREPTAAGDTTGEKNAPSPTNAGA